MLISLALIGSDVNLLCSDWFNSSVKHKTCVYVCVCLSVRVYVHVYVSVSVFLYMCMYAYVCKYVTCVGFCVCECVRTILILSLCYGVNSPDGQISRSNKATNYLP